MHKNTATIRTGNSPISKMVIVAALTLFACGALLWWAALLHHRSIVGAPSLIQGAADDAAFRFEANRTGPAEPEDQIIFSRASSAKVAREAAAFQRFRDEISAATQGLDNSGAGINSSVERLTSLNSCLSLTFLMVKDFFTGGSGVDTIFIAEVGGLDRITSSSVNKAKQAVDRLSVALTIIEDSYSETLIAGPGVIRVATGVADGVVGGDQARETRQLASARAIAFDSSLGSASALLSAAALAKSANRSAWRALGVVEKKAVRRMSVAAIPAVIDGPLPIGDMVALALESGCLAWSFYEVYEAQGVLKRDLRFELSGIINQNSKQIHDWAMSVGNELMEAAALSMPVPVGGAMAHL